MVLLKNNGVLPLGKGLSVAVSGCYARPESGMVAGGGSSQVTWRGKGFDLAALLEERLKSAVTYETMFSFDGVVGHGEFGSDPDGGASQSRACRRAGRVRGNGRADGIRERRP